MAKLPGQRFTRDERDFLPAALEIIEKPPSPTSRWTAITIVALFALALGWACYSRIDVVAIAEGRLVPSGRVKLVQPLEAGIVSAINVRDGMAVRRGQVLIELDPGTISTERRRLAQEFAAAEVNAARLRALLGAESLADVEESFAPPENAPESIIRTQRRLMEGQWRETEARTRVLLDDIERRRAERAGIQATVTGLKGTVPVLRQRLDIRERLEREGNGTRIALLEDKQRLLTAEQDLAVASERLREVAATIALAENQARQYESEIRRTRLAELNEAEQRAASLKQELAGAEIRERMRTLDAPIDGTVQQLAVHTVGGVVTPAQQLLVIVPADDTLEVAATLQNKDVGFVEAGQVAEVKIETFLFTRYGTIPGRVVTVSSDAVVDVSPFNTRAKGQEQPQSPSYATRVRLDRTNMDIDGRSVRLSPGMRATVEIKTSQRRVIDFLISPILRYRQESLRER
jgi:hemolysin D